MEGDTSDQCSVERNTLQTAAALKKAGNAAYVAKEYRKALGKYHIALIQLKSIGIEPADSVLFGAQAKKIPEELLVSRDQLKSECYNNLAACLLAKGSPLNYEKIAQHCENALKLDPGNVKAIFRYGTALYQLGKLDKAIEVLTSTPACHSEKSIQTLLKTVRAQDKVNDDKLKATYQRMFASDTPPKSETNGHSHSDPIIIKSNMSAESHSSPKDGAGQGTKLIQVASIHNEAAC